MCLLLAKLDVCCGHFCQSVLSKRIQENDYVSSFLSLIPYIFLSYYNS